MEQRYETRVAGNETTQQVELLQRNLGFRAYRVVTEEDPTGRQVVMGDVGLVYTPANMNQAFVDEPMLPIQEFSK